MTNYIDMKKQKKKHKWQASAKYPKGFGSNGTKPESMKEEEIIQ